ncbi:hypothetical protein H9623_04690 [Oerskovia sp. Sa1BUA8]|uniref:Uncharacterized protein n=1 Tax=Oerskovia douganii TaxID=2762210 RepID=A0A9D5UAW5_9CELL|nr:hypothetical protein [Oerskovia douganii]MBE7699606.1 hypothetical protein [Oerskovia douganii]
MSTVLFALLATLAVVMTDLHDRAFPQSIGAHATVSIDVSASSMDDDEVFAELGALSDDLGLGLVKVAPDLSGDQSGRVFVVVGERGPGVSAAPLFNDGTAQIRGSEALASSYASGQYLVTGDTARVAGLREWLDREAITARWTDDTTAGTLRALVVQQSFGVTVLAAISLLGEVDDALAQNPGLVEDLESIGSSVSVETGLPCDDQPDRALVRIIYTSGDQRRQIDTLLQQDTFGVPAQVIQQ